MGIFDLDNKQQWWYWRDKYGQWNGVAQREVWLKRREKKKNSMMILTFFIPKYREHLLRMKRPKMKKKARKRRKERKKRRLESKKAKTSFMGCRKLKFTWRAMMKIKK